ILNRPPVAEAAGQRIGLDHDRQLLVNGHPLRQTTASILTWEPISLQGVDVPHKSGYRKGPGCLINPVTNGGRRHVPTGGSGIPRHPSSSLRARQETQENTPPR